MYSSVRLQNSLRLVTCFSLLLSSTIASSPSSADSVGAWSVEGLIPRVLGKPVKPIIKTWPEWPVAIYDKHGDSNQLIVLLDLDDIKVIGDITGLSRKPESSAEAEVMVVEALNLGSAFATKYFGEATQARHLIQEGRIENEARAMFDKDAPEERLQRYIVLNYPTVETARKAQEALRLNPSVRHVEMESKMNFTWSPNDYYFPVVAQSAGYYQWGMHAMNFPQAWDKTKGHGQVGIIDAGFLNNQPPVDLTENFRSQFSFVYSNPDPNRELHGTHVAGIIAATSNNSIGVSGACPNCSATMARFDGSTMNSADALLGLIDRGMQVVNMSYGKQSSCADSSMSAVCTAISVADNKDVLLVAAAGNNNLSVTNFPANHGSVLSVGGAMNLVPNLPYLWASWEDGTGVFGSNNPGLQGIMAPAKSIVSTVPAGADYYNHSSFRCSDLLPIDESGIHGDGYGSCTGTSMAAPHISALAGMVRSINPRLSRVAVKSIIRSSGTHAAAPNAEIGSGMARADLAVNSAIAQTPNLLSPLFSLFSFNRSDFLMTTVPQMASAATWGTLRPINTPGINTRYVSAGGFAVNGYPNYPGGYSDPNDNYAPVAAAWVFTTPQNPKNPAATLVPLYRLSWKCGDYTPYPPALCSSFQNHMDTVHTTDSAGLAAYESWGYKLDGIDGYIYPKTAPQPAGTVKLMRKYNPARDDHAIFPETVMNYFTSLGYIENSGSEWLGYVYPNSNGNVPPIY